ncbi:MAG: hypothetical protein AAGJ28_22560 [Pseudomonadota bacterium]
MTNHPDSIRHPAHNPEWQAWAVQISKIIARAWTDDDFCDRLVKEPREILKEYGLAVPDDMKVVVKRNAKKWTMSGASLTDVDLLELPLPPKPDADEMLKAWADGEPGHPPVISAGGKVGYAGIPSGVSPSAARRFSDAAFRRFAEDSARRRFAEDATARRFAEDGARRRFAEDSMPRRFTDDAVPRRFVEDAAARRFVEDDDPRMAEDSPARRFAEGAAARRFTEDAASPGDAGADKDDKPKKRRPRRPK